MKKIFYIILISTIFCGCLSQQESSCPANRSVAMISNGNNFAPPISKRDRETNCPANTGMSSGNLESNFAPPFENRGKGMDCPANSKPLKYLASAQTNCPANVTERETVKLEEHSVCPPAAFGAEKLLGYIDDMEVISDKHATYKTDPVSGKKTSQSKGIRTGEIEKPVKPSKEQLAYYRKKKAEEKAIIRQIKHDLVEYNKEPPL